MNTCVSPSAVSINEHFKHLTETVIKGDYCVGCGACASLAPDAVAMKLDWRGTYQPHIIASTSTAANPSIQPEAICPFGDRAENEDQLALPLFGELPNSDHHIGYWSGLYAGYVTTGNYRANGTSGGISNWVLAHLLETGEVDAVIQVRPTEDPASGALFQYTVATTVEEVTNGAKTRYYPCHMADVLQYVSANDMRFAVVSLPCFAKALRLLRTHNQVLDERIRFQVSLVCGHLKSTAYARYYGWWSGIKPDELASLDFRYKSEQAATAKNYFIRASRRGSEESVVTPNKAVYGTDWGYGYFKLKACDYCDDVLGETADLTVGDAWLPKYYRDPQGTNLVISRNIHLDALLKAAQTRGELKLEGLTRDEVVASQEAGFRHRRDGLAYRLFLRDRESVWRPRKRVSPGASHLTWRYRAIFKLREALRDQSHAAFHAAVEQGDLQVFVKQMRPLMRRYDVLYKQLNVSFWKRGVKRLLSKARPLMAKVVSAGR